MQPRQKYSLHGDQVYERKRIHTFRIGDCDDPEIYAAQPILEWQATEMGLWVMEHTLDPTFHIVLDPMTYGYRVAITAHVTPKRWTEFCLRFS